MIKLTWKQLEKKVKELYKKIDWNNIKTIYAIPRGGLIIAVMLSHLSGKPVISLLNSLDNKTLIVDDIADTGTTLHHVRYFMISTIHYKPRSVVKPDYYIDEIEDNEWVQYPWETKTSSKIDYMEDKK